MKVYANSNNPPLKQPGNEAKMLNGKHHAGVATGQVSTMQFAPLCVFVYKYILSLSLIYS